MNSRGSSHRLSSSPSSFRNRISFLMLSMFATMAAFYVAGRLWQEAEERVYLINELDKRTGQGKSAVSVDDTLKIISCREQQRKLASLHMELEKARQEGFVAKRLSENGGMQSKKKLLAVIGIVTTFGHKNNRDAIRKAWMSTGAALQKLEEDKGIVIRFVIGRSANQGDSLDREIESENGHTKDFIILNDHVEAPKEQAKKTKLFFTHAIDHWDAEFYAKVNDDIYINIDYHFTCGWLIAGEGSFEGGKRPGTVNLPGFVYNELLGDALGAVLSSHLDHSRAYIGCMKSGEVFSNPSHKWYEPDWWKFGDGKSYFRHASGEIFAISQALARFISINRLFLRTYSHDDVSAGSWFIGLDVKHVDEGKFCCSSWASGAVCAAA